VRALRRRAEAIRKKAAPGVTVLDGCKPVVVVDSKSAHACFAPPAIGTRSPMSSRRHEPRRH